MRVQPNSTLPLCSTPMRRSENALPSLTHSPSRPSQTPGGFCRETRDPPTQWAPPHPGPAPRGSRKALRAPFGRRGCSGSQQGRRGLSVLSASRSRAAESLLVAEFLDPGEWLEDSGPCRRGFGRHQGHPPAPARSPASQSARLQTAFDLAPLGPAAGGFKLRALGPQDTLLCHSYPLFCLG